MFQKPHNVDIYYFLQSEIQNGIEHQRKAMERSSRHALCHAKDTHPKKKFLKTLVKLTFQGRRSQL